MNMFLKQLGYEVSLKFSRIVGCRSQNDFFYWNKIYFADQSLSIDK